MAKINDFLSYIDFESMREYCMANGNAVSYAKGDYFAETWNILNDNDSSITIFTIAM